MRIWKTLSGLVLSAAFLFVGQTVSAQSSDLELRAVVAEEHTVAISCAPGGKIRTMDGQDIDQTAVFKHGSAVVLRICPDEGYEIEAVFMGETDVTDRVDASGVLRLDPLMNDCYLSVKFRKLIPDGPSDVPTGHPAPLMPWWLCGGSLLALVGIVCKKRSPSGRRTAN